VGAEASKDMGKTQKALLEAQANRILARAGYSADGLGKKSKRESVRTILTPCGGQPGYRRK